MNRRKFLKTTTAVAVGSTLGRRAEGRRVDANDKVNLALMGVRGRGRYLTEVFASFPDVNISHICDVDQNVVGPAFRIVEEKKKTTPKLEDDIRRVLEDKSVDAVIMGTPIHWHAAGTILACDAGKDVYVEKPASHNIAEGRLMVKAARRNNRIVQLGTQARSRPITRRFIDYVHSGEIGDLLMVKVGNVQMRRNIGHKPDEPVPAGLNYDIWTGPMQELPFNRNHFHSTVNWNWHYGCGDIGNDGVHWLDVARWVLGVEYPTEVSGSGRKLFFDDDQQTPDTQNITYNFKDKVILFEQRLWNTYRLEGSENTDFVYGTEGTVQTGRWHQGRHAFRVFDGKGELVHFEQEQSSEEGVLAHARNFIDCIRSRELPSADIETGHVSTALCHLGNIVTRTGRNIRFDAATETVIDDPKANQLTGGNYRDHWSSEPLKSPA